MKVVILAGGFGTRISEDSYSKPKPMIEIGGTPILLHILRYYYQQGFDDFIICGGYKCFFIKEYFSNYFLHNSDVIFNYKKNNEVKFENTKCEKWKVTIVDTGLETQTAGRIKKIEKYIGKDENFMLTYGDGLSNIDLKDLEKAHSKDSIITLSSIQLEGRFGSLKIENDKILGFSEKTKDNGGWINAGFMILNRKIFDYITNESDSLEFDILPKVALEKKLGVYKHYGFWKCMDTLKDKNEFEKLIKEGNLPWKKLN